MIEPLSQRDANRSLTLRLWLFAAGFLAFGFALVPLYNVLCDVTGYGDRSKLVKATAFKESAVPGREVTVEMLANVPGIGDWEFRPAANQIQVRLGRFTEAKFYAHNLRKQPATAQAVPSIVPTAATQYFHKTECFCFTPQPFAAGQERELLVRFVIDPKLPLHMDRVTLSYTLYSADPQGG